MTKREQKRFIRELVENVKKELLTIDYPEAWDGHELRWLLADRFQEVVIGCCYNKKSKRYKDYRNEVLINNWTR